MKFSFIRAKKFRRSMHRKEFVVESHTSKWTSSDRASVARDTSRGSLSSPSWRAVDSIFRRVLIEKHCKPTFENALNTAPFIFFMIENSLTQPSSTRTQTELD
jgi:hypothetical protein